MARIPSRDEFAWQDAQAAGKFYQDNRAAIEQMVAVANQIRPVLE